MLNPTGNRDGCEFAGVTGAVLLFLVCSYVLLGNVAPAWAEANTVEPPIPKTDRPMIYGVLETSVNEDMCRKMQRAGMTNIRYGISWWDIEKTRGTYDWGRSDRAIELLDEYGIKVVACICTTPEWAIEAAGEVKALLAKKGFSAVYGTAPWAPEFWPDYERYLRALTRRYSEQIDHWELWNEVDGLSGIRLIRNKKGHVVDLDFGGDAEWYSEVVRRSYRIFKEEDPGCLVCVGALESKADYQIDLLTALYQEGCAPFFDAVSVHSYGNPLKFPWISKVHQTMVEYGDSHKEVWVTEWGMKGPPITKKARILNALRYFRETPWITVANAHTYGHTANPPENFEYWRRMVEEEGPRERYQTGFEEGDILECWGRKADLEYREGEAHSGRRAVYCHAQGEEPPECRVSLYTRALHPTLSFWCNVHTPDPQTRVHFNIEVYPAEFVAGSLVKSFMEYGVPHDTWFHMKIPFLEHFQRFDGNIIMFVSIMPIPETPGIEFWIDDVTLEGISNPLYRKMMDE